jgi:glycerol kinase
MVKNTYGTGCFMLNGDKPVYSKNNLLTTVAWKINGKTTYLRRKCVGGAAVQWLRRRKMINTAAEIETLAASVPDNGGVYFVL